jgi:hypothetical protein
MLQQFSPFSPMQAICSSSPHIAAGRRSFGFEFDPRQHSGCICSMCRSGPRLPRVTESSVIKVTELHTLLGL